jgi:hypothetical protein
MNSTNMFIPATDRGYRRLADGSRCNHSRPAPKVLKDADKTVCRRTNVREPMRVLVITKRLLPRDVRNQKGSRVRSISVRAITL